MTANHLPVKNLVKVNWIISFMSSILVVTFFVAVTHDIPASIMRFLQTFLFVGILSFADLALLSIFSVEKRPRDKYVKVKFYLSSYLAAIIIWIFVKNLYSFVTGLMWEGEGKGKNIYQAYFLAILSIWVLNTLIVVLQDLVMLQHKKAQAEIENLQLRANVSETANLLLRQQIHPHFLFNALNTIKSLYKQDLQQGENYLVHLANFLRVSISNHTTKTTLVKNELEFCLDYLEMQKIRFASAFNYEITISAETAQQKYLPYFSLQPLLENALKHNDLTEERPLFLSVKEEGEYLVVTNNIQQRRVAETSTGIGLANLAERYQLLAGEEMLIRSDTQFFKVYIKILNK